MPRHKRRRWVSRAQRCSSSSATTVAASICRSSNSNAWPKLLSACLERPLSALTAETATFCSADSLEPPIRMLKCQRTGRAWAAERAENDTLLAVRIPWTTSPFPTQMSFDTLREGLLLSWWFCRIGGYFGRLSSWRRDLPTTDDGRTKSHLEARGVKECASAEP